MIFTIIKCDLCGQVTREKDNKYFCLFYNYGNIVIATVENASSEVNVKHYCGQECLFKAISAQVSPKEKLTKDVDYDDPFKDAIDYDAMNSIAQELSKKDKILHEEAHLFEANQNEALSSLYDKMSPIVNIADTSDLTKDLNKAANEECPF